MATPAPAEFAHVFDDFSGVTMFQKSILVMGTAAAIAAAMMSAPAKAGWFWEENRGVVTGPAPTPVRGQHVAARDAEPRWMGSPAWQKPVRASRADTWGSGWASVGPDRHTICALQPRYDRKERYVGSREVCWVEAR